MASSLLNIHPPIRYFLDQIDIHGIEKGRQMERISTFFFSETHVVRRL